MTANAYASVAKARMCCMDAQCDVAQCLEMGCLPAPAPLAMTQPAVFGLEQGGRETGVEAVRHVPTHYQDIWTPPD